MKGFIERMRVLVIGGNGMLGRDVVAAFRREHTVKSADRTTGDYTVDITDRVSTDAVLAGATPDVVVNCAAYTNVDGAETARDEAFRVNAWGTWNLAAACDACGIPLMHVSTDFVFDGEKGEPYDEFDTPNPINAYGASKLAGEEAIQRTTNRFWIVRTQWLYGAHGKCFPGTMLKLAGDHRTIQVVDDQFGAPAYTADVAATMKTIVEECPYGIYHANNAGECSWYEFARAILERAGHDPDAVRPIHAADYESPTRRPTRSTLRRLSLEMQGKDNAPTWQTALDRYIKTL